MDGFDLPEDAKITRELVEKVRKASGNEAAIAAVVEALFTMERELVKLRILVDGVYKRLSE